MIVSPEKMARTGRPSTVTCINLCVEKGDLEESNNREGRRLAPGQLRAHSPPQESKQAAGQKIVRNAIGAPPAACKENDPQLDRRSQSEAHKQAAKQAARCRREGLLSP